jgi:site-specific DNA-methyltransferase (adenine-specific)
MRNIDGRASMKTYTVEIGGTRMTILRDRDGKFLTPPGWGGMGSALKPANEPICMARKPLDGTIAHNLLKHGTGAINIEACRVGDRGETQFTGAKTTSRVYGAIDVAGGKELPPGRWPANLIHDGSEEVLERFPETGLSVGGSRGAGGQNGIYSEIRAQPNLKPGLGDSGSAARFFYTAKADNEDRLGSKHPTVKPLDLIQYLCRLITRPGGTILDPFSGTGTLGEAAFREGCKAILIEREQEYQSDIVKRMGLCLSGPEERRRETIKHAGLTADAGPLFGGGSMMVNRAGGTLPQGSRARKGRSVYGVFADEKGSPNE